jgi:hypothetical protein
MDHAGRPKLAIKLRILAFQAIIAQIDLVFFAFVAVLSACIFRAATHFQSPFLGFAPTDP